jgi:ribosomal-protein-alanine N-acetyltransferase
MMIRSEDVRIRPMISADVGRVREIANSLPQAPHWPLAAYLEALDPHAQPRRIALVAENPEIGVVGFAVASLVPPQAELETIAVATKFQRNGLARQIFSALASSLRAAEAIEVLLEVRASNAHALALYRSLGFRESGFRPRYYADPEEDAILLSLLLD